MQQALENRAIIYLLQSLAEGEIKFLPSYKFDPKTNNYDTSSKMRVPSYTDRVLFFSNPDQLRLLNYTVIPQVDFSDHRPVIGMFEV